MFITYIGITDLAIMAVLQSILFSIYNVAFGFSFSVSTLVGNSIGAGNERQAKTYMRDGLFTCLVFFLITLGTIFVFRE